MAVVAALKFDKELPIGERACKSNRRHRRFSARTDKAKLFDGREAARHELCQVTFCRRGSAKTCASRRRILNCCDHARFSMSENHRPPGADIIDVAIAIRIPEIRTISPRDKWRLSADSAKGAHRGI